MKSKLFDVPSVIVLRPRRKPYDFTEMTAALRDLNDAHVEAERAFKRFARKFP